MRSSLHKVEALGFIAVKWLNSQVRSVVGAFPEPRAQTAADDVAEIEAGASGALQIVTTDAASPRQAART